MMTKSASSTGAALLAANESSDLTEFADFRSFLPNPVFVLDLENRFIYLNQAAEIFFQSSRMILLGTSLTSIIPADSNFCRWCDAPAHNQYQLVIRGLNWLGLK